MPGSSVVILLAVCYWFLPVKNGLKSACEALTVDVSWAAGPVLLTAPALCKLRTSCLIRPATFRRVLISSLAYLRCDARSIEEALISAAECKLPETPI